MYRIAILLLSATCVALGTSKFWGGWRQGYVLSEYVYYAIALGEYLVAILLAGCRRYSRRLCQLMLVAVAAALAFSIWYPTPGRCGCFGGLDDGWRLGRVLVLGWIGGLAAFGWLYDRRTSVGRPVRCAGNAGE
jgi:hypothetical protein